MSIVIGYDVWQRRFSGDPTILGRKCVTGLSAKDVAVVIAYMALMMAVCTLACIVPTRRGAVEPAEALLRLFDSAKGALRGIPRFRDAHPLRK